MTPNPIIANELRTRFRGRFAPVGFTVWLLVVVGLGYLTYLLGLLQVSQNFGFGEVGNRAIAGRAVFDWLVMLLLTAVLVVVPAVGGLSLAIERDRATLPLLQVTQLGPWGLVMGKWASSVLYVMTLIVSVAPILAVPILIGGVSWADLFGILAFLLLVVLTVGAISLWSSARSRTLRGAMFASYFWVFVLVVATVVGVVTELVALPESRFDPVGPDGREFVTMWANPYAGALSVMVEPLESSGVTDRRWMTLSGSMADLFMQRQPESFRRSLDGGAPIDSTRSPLWWRTVVVYAGITPLALAGAARAVRAPGEPRRFVSRRRAPVS